MIIALAIAGLALVVATLVWFAGDSSGNSDAASADLDARASSRDEGARSTAPNSRHTDAANATHSNSANTAHLALPAQLSTDTSPFGALEGRIVDWGTRVGVAGAELEFISRGVTHSAVTGADGSYRFEAPSEGAWALAIVTAEGYLPYAPELGRGGVVWVSSPYQKLERADLFLFPRVDYAGTVVDTEGRPVADADIELFGADSGELALVGIESSFHSDADGRFVFHAPDFALLEARHPDHPTGRARVDAPAQLSHTLTITMGGVPNPSQAAITGRIIDGAGQPLAGVEVRTMPTRIGGRDPSLARAPTAVSDAEGRFVLAPLDDLTYVVGAQLSARPWVQSGAVKPGDEVELRLEDGLEIAGRLVDQHGDPVVAGSVSLLRVYGPLRRSRVANLSVFDPGGAFSFGGLGPGHYELEAIAQGRARSKPVKVKLPRSGGPVKIVLGTGGSFYGRVVDASTGEPLALAHVSVNGLASGDSVMPSLSSTVTDTEGAFELTGIEAGRISVDVAAFDHDSKILSGIQITAGERHGPVEIALAPVAEGEQPKVELAGIGVAIAPTRDAIYIRDVVEGGGAEEAGIVAGDSIIGVDGVSVVELGFEGSMQNIRGQAGTKVVIELRRKGDAGASPESVIVQRRVISGV
ncbi:carboxypeptidase regulatory-like domain-containing protein [Enhygromyxa salina]|uniref:Nickel uptake substrate-specific transmembrane region n=1 Tax=Enhygromyxa salina TaxID=215803 RepID=A0A2S9XLE6_9BACT|nr:carboxypeptidase regulatory-like domain-containing protein [Enhygromyxa salina]PRP93699.1 Nickel uptake substrate-specific transmembrane region [Enhygromyxa salina]